MQDRRRFITLVPFAGAALLAACSKETSNSGAAPTAAPAPAAAPAPYSAPAPVAAAPVATDATSGPAGAKLPLLSPDDPLAISLGYVALASQADAGKYKTFAPGQACSNCSLYGAKAGDSQGPCPLFAGKHVLAAAWCSGYVKKAG